MKNKPIKYLAGSITKNKKGHKWCYGYSISIPNGGGGGNADTVQECKDAIEKVMIGAATRKDKDNARLNELAPLIVKTIKVAAENELLSVDAGKKSIAAAIEAGNLLIEAKRLVGDGSWYKWVETNIKKSQDTVDRYMKLADPAHVRDIKECDTLRQAYLATGIIKPPKEKTASKNKTIEKTDYQKCFGHLNQAWESVLILDEADQAKIFEQMTPLVMWYNEYQSRKVATAEALEEDFAEA